MELVLGHGLRIICPTIFHSHFLGLSAMDLALIPSCNKFGHKNVIGFGILKFDSVEITNDIC